MVESVFHFNKELSGDSMRCACVNTYTHTIHTCIHIQIHMYVCVYVPFAGTDS
jgi:hypothetical protein